MEGFAAVDFGFAREVLQRGIAALYVIAFTSTLLQFPALLGERGLLPVPRLLQWAATSKARTRMLRPTVFRLVRYTDARLRILCAGGILVALSLVAGLPQLGAPWVPMLCFLALWLGYMSITSVGQTFYGFGWEMLLLEAGFLAAFLGSADQPPPTVVIVLFWWLVFRLEFGAGLIKIRGGSEWRDLTALMYHHETQPMPGPLSRQAHLLPAWFHRGEVVGNHVAQLVVPWFLFAPVLGLVVPGPVPAIVGAVAAALVIATQLWLVATGNFAWLNWATIVLAFSAIGLPGIGAASSAGPAGGAGAAGAAGGIPLYWIVVTAAVFGGYVVISWPAARNLAARRQLMNASFNRWQLANAYGAFGSVTRQRVEVVVEGTLDDDPRTTAWREYGFHGKPGDPRAIPRQWAPYHLRLDWLMWFLPLGRIDEDWFQAFLGKLLEADPATLRLIRHDPFVGERPSWIRARTYLYRFSTRAEFRATHRRWIREPLGVAIGPVRLAPSTSP
ncbi:lipase maturation factor family protein [Microbacterium sp. X-17]|uniref:lipase maturation factor family protein n=1 Tax=Microbacterium sp. X-17 TaxID=3144404 RepID=UPI0031F58596